MESVSEDKMDFMVNEIPNEDINADALLEPAAKRLKLSDYMFSLFGAPLDVEDTVSIDLTGNEECSSNDYESNLKIIKETAFTINEESTFDDFTKNPASMECMYIAPQKENVTSYAEDNTVIDLTENEECASNDFENDSTDLAVDQGVTLTAAECYFKVNHVSLENVDFAPLKENITSDVEDNAVIDLTAIEEGVWNDYQNDLTIIEEIGCKSVMIDLTVNKETALNASGNEFTVNTVGTENVYIAPPHKNVTSYGENNTVDLTTNEECASNDVENMFDFDFAINPVSTGGMDIVSPNENVTSGASSVIDLTENEECEPNSVDDNASINEDTASSFVKIVDNVPEDACRPNFEDANQPKFENKTSIDETLLDVLRVANRSCQMDIHHKIVDKEELAVNTPRHNKNEWRIQRLGADSVIDFTENEECEPNSVDDNASINEDTASSFVKIVVPEDACRPNFEDANQPKFEDKTSIDETLLDVLRVADRSCQMDIHHKIVDKEELAVNTPRHNKNEWRIQRLSEALYQLKKKIADLEEAEVDWEDENNSQFMIIERYKIRACKIYEKLNEISGVSGTSHLCDRKPITFKGTSFLEFNQTLEHFVNKTRTFPDLFDVLKCLQNCNQQYDYQLSEEDCLNTAKDAFLKIGVTLKKRRKSDFYKMFSYYANCQVDPALDDPVLKAKLSSNRKHNKT